MNFYNEIDPKAAHVLRALMGRGLIAPGVVDERSIADIQPYELEPYCQCHFFCGEGGWPLAFQLAGIPADYPAWSGSAPCQSFSLGGARRGGDDPRHLWPSFYRLIRERKPPAVFGEQVEAAVSFGWFDALANDLEAENYAVGSAVLRAGCSGAPHDRPRLYWGASADSFGQGGEGLEPCRSAGEVGSWGLRGPEDLQSICEAPFEPGNRWPQPLLRRVDDGLFARVDQLRIHGNAIVPQVALGFIRASWEAMEDMRRTASAHEGTPRLRRTRRP